MSFESGTMNFRMFYIPRQVPENYVQRLAAHAAGGLEGVTAELTAGWVTGRHLLDRNITEESIMYGGYMRATLRLANRAVPASILQAECRMEELAAAASTGQTFVNRKVRAEIRQAVMERLLPAQTPKLAGIPLVHQPGSPVLYAGAMSDSQSDLLISRWQQTMGFSLIRLNHETIETNVDVNDFPPVSFSAGVDDVLMENHAGRDFLTWLWFMAESGRGTVRINQEHVGVLLEGPLTFVHEGAGSHVTVLRNGEPMGSAEAKACLMAGKKLRRCRLTFAIGEDVWKCGFDADDFLVRSLRVPELDGNLDPVSRFQSRIHALDRFIELLHGAYREFLNVRTSDSWRDTVKIMREWTAGRTSRV